MYRDYPDEKERTHSGGGVGPAILFIILAAIIGTLFFKSLSIKPGILKIVPVVVDNSKVRVTSFTDISNSCIKNGGISGINTFAGPVDTDMEIICNDGMSRKITNIPANK